MASPQEALSKLRENKAVYLRRVGSSEWQKSRVETVLGKVLHVAHPTEKGRLWSITSNENLEIGFSAQEEFYSFLSAVLEIRRKPVPLLILQRPSGSELVQVQRRRSPRADSLIPLSYEIQGGSGLLTTRHTLALSLSASGLSFNSPEPISPGSGLRMEIQIPNVTGSLTTRGEVVACSKVLNSREERYKVRVKFNLISASNRVRINEFVRRKTEAQKAME
jgi:c-di-GMP-binding flagellar brake protein YcgR